MVLKIKSKYGEFEVGGGVHEKCRLLEIAGLGLPARDIKTVKFEGEAGYTISSKTDNARTITMSIDFSGGPDDALEILHILQEECEIFIYSAICQRKIKAICISGAEIEKIIFGRMHKAVLQFECPNPYFEDINDPSISLSTRTNMFPTSYEGGTGYITLPAVATVRTSEKVITNSGDVSVFPKFTITAYGTMQNIKLQNRTTGAVIKLNYTIVSGEVITVDVKNREITSSIHGNIINKQSDDTVLDKFCLTEGENDLLLANNTGHIMDIDIQFANQYKAVMLA